MTSHPLHDCACTNEDQHQRALLAERRAAYVPAWVKRATARTLPVKDYSGSAR